MKHPRLKRFLDFVDGKGFYIVLFLCVAALGISGYYLVSTMSSLTEPQSLAAAGGARVTVTPDPVMTPSALIRPVPPTISQRPVPTPSHTAAPEPEPAPTPEPTPAVTSTSTVFTWPLKGEVLTNFSVEALAYDVTMGDWRTHDGVDIAAQPGTRVMAAAGGTVIDIVQDPLMGTTVYLDHGTGITSVYSNLAAAPVVEIGDVVSTGTVLGTVGSTAIAESCLPCHLHFAMSQDGNPTDPLGFLP